ncbi:DUF106 domain-containing protein [Candidatus Bathyarchaeota archaeon]|nr:MAG: DUF106 domain-containing protein [Candidatus Bathyarchaeota archaeon]RJS81908.1 MAG: DUF106 domain-containing protein [Candidatus Bathyarchaeota archaeon]
MVNPLEWLLMPQAPGATVAIMIICALISFANSSINRFLINRLVGWKQYRIMQKEIAEYQSLTRQALRTKDKKLMEKIKKKEPQIMNMQKKMAKPQLIMFAIPFLYLLVWWLVLLPLYGANPVAYIPGIGGITIFYWYFIVSSLFGILASRLLGMMPIE